MKLSEADIKKFRYEIRKGDEQRKKDQEEAEEKELEKRIRPGPVTRAIISHLQSHGASKMEDIIASTPIAHLVEEQLERLEREGYLEEKEGYYFISRKKKYN